MPSDAFTNLSNAISDIFAAAGILLAGLWTLYNFGITRVSAPQIEIQLSLKSVVATKNGQVAILALIVKNTGRTKVKKRYAILEIKDLNISDNWGALTRVSNPLEYKTNIHKILTTHDYLEPSEVYHEEISFLVTDIQFLQAGIVFVGSRKYQTWEANYIFDLSLPKHHQSKRAPELSPEKQRSN